MKKRIFLVDDEADFLDMMKLSLETMGHYTVEHHHVAGEVEAEEAVARARSFDPDLILLDVMMPHLDGSELADRLAQDRVLRDVPVLFLTALVTRAESQTGGACTSGGRTFLPKDIGTSVLIECIERTLAEHAVATS